MTNKEFCNNALLLVGDSYEKTDCIGVIRKAAHIRCQGTNWLYRSFDTQGKYHYLTERYTPTKTPVSGTLVFRVNYNQIPSGYTDKPNCYHVGVIIGPDVVQSNPKTGVYKSPFNLSEWDCAGWLKFIEKPEDEVIPDQRPELSDHEMLVAIYNKLFDSID